jgi:cystathionine beta-lyase family protein involved in aluminum resistance
MTSAAILIKKGATRLVAPGFGDESGADLDADDLFALVMPALGAGAVALVAQMIALRTVVQLRRVELAVASPALADAALG